MLEDLIDRHGDVATAKAAKLELRRGDARNLEAVSDESVGLCALLPALPQLH